jgi:hypothetical protein
MSVESRLSRLEARFPPKPAADEPIEIDLEPYSDDEQAALIAGEKLFAAYRGRSPDELVAELSEDEKDLVLRCDRLIRFGTEQTGNSR